MSLCFRPALRNIKPHLTMKAGSLGIILGVAQAWYGAPPCHEAEGEFMLPRIRPGPDGMPEFGREVCGKSCTEYHYNKTKEGCPGVPTSVSAEPVCAVSVYGTAFCILLCESEFDCGTEGATCETVLPEMNNFFKNQPESICFPKQRGPDKAIFWDPGKPPKQPYTRSPTELVVESKQDNIVSDNQEVEARKSLQPCGFCARPDARDAQTGMLNEDAFVLFCSTCPVEIVGERLLGLYQLAARQTKETCSALHGIFLLGFGAGGCALYVMLWVMELRSNTRNPMGNTCNLLS